MAESKLPALSVLDLHRSVRGAASVGEMLDRVVEVAVRAIDGCDHASITVIERGVPLTAAHDGEAALSLDAAQFLGDDGPSLEAYRTATTVLVAAMGEDGRWPAYATAAARQGVEASLSLPLAVDDVARGVLNLYSGRSFAFTVAGQLAAESFAEQAAIAMANAVALVDADRTMSELRVAIETRDVIGQAKGILMERHRLSADAAFEVLRGASQKRNVKLRAIAEELATTGENPGA